MLYSGKDRQNAPVVSDTGSATRKELHCAPSSRNPVLSSEESQKLLLAIAGTLPADSSNKFVLKILQSLLLHGANTGPALQLVHQHTAAGSCGCGHGPAKKPDTDPRGLLA